MNERIELTGLWANKDKDGNTFLSGSLGRAKVLVFKNTHKQEGEKTPDYRMFIVPRDRQENKRPDEGRTDPPASASVAPKDDLPF